MAEHIHYEQDEEKLKITGYLRSRPLSVNGLVHIPGVGDFQMSQVTTNCNLIGQLLCHIKYIVQIDTATDLCPLKPSHSRAQSGLMEVSLGRLVHVAIMTCCMSTCMYM